MPSISTDPLPGGAAAVVRADAERLRHFRERQLALRDRRLPRHSRYGWIAITLLVVIFLAGVISKQWGV